jgi:two-component system, NtrC family, response regulator HydG
MVAPAAGLPILIVDDDRNLCTVIQKLLALRHYQVDVAYNGNMALELVEHKPYGLALIDFRMPGMNGVELYNRIKMLRPNVIGVFLTGYPTIDTVYPAIQLGVQRVLSKPANFDELFEVIEEYVGRPP